MDRLLWATAPVALLLVILNFIAARRGSDYRVIVAIPDKDSSQVKWISKPEKTWRTELNERMPYLLHGILIGFFLGCPTWVWLVNFFD